MEMGEQYEFHIDAFSPANMPMARLAEYMADFADLLGYKEHVHFDALREGSAAIACHAEPVSARKVRMRLEEVRYGTAPKEAMKACREIDDKLREDNATGWICAGGARVIQFPGRNAAVEATLGPIIQTDALDGEIIQVGGRDETINVHVRAGKQIYHCITSKPLARQLAAHIFGSPVRLKGKASWARSESGVWTLRRFEIESFYVLDETPIGRLFESLRLRMTPPEGGRQNPADLVRELRED